MTSLQETRLTTKMDQTAAASPGRLLSPRRAPALSLWRRLREFLTHYGFGLITILTCSVLVGLIVTLLWRSLPILRTYPLLTLLTETRWMPSKQLFGMAPFLIGSVAVTALA